VDGHNWWEWVFVGSSVWSSACPKPNVVLHVIRPSQGEDVITDVKVALLGRAARGP